MKSCKWIVFVFVFNSFYVFSQQKYASHTISNGETISEIAQIYNVDISDLYKLNPKAVNGIKEKMVLLIPNETKKSISVSTLAITSQQHHKTHEVLPQETLFGIAKKYNIFIQDLYKINPNLENQGLKIGQTINIPSTAYEKPEVEITPNKKNEEKIISDSTKNVSNEKIVASPKLENKINISKSKIEYKVLPKESLYSIAKKYQISIADLQNANPNLDNKSLKAGQKITIPVNKDLNSSLVVEKKEIKSQEQIDAIAQVENDNNKPKFEISHEVLPKETKYGIAKEYGITISELEKQNPSISKKLLVGSVITIRTSKEIEKEVVTEATTINDSSFDVEKYENKDPNTTNNFVDELISIASEHIGTPYRYGGTTKDGFDCSGLICYTFSNSNIKLPRSSIEMASYGSKINIEEAQKGDLVFFKTNGRRHINHVGMVVEVSEGEIKFIHSSNHGGVIISSTKESYYQKNLVQVNRVL